LIAVLHIKFAAMSSIMFCIAANTCRSASYLDLHLKLDSEGRAQTNLYDKKHEKDYLNFPIVNFLFITFSKASPDINGFRRFRTPSFLEILFANISK
jgi:hypothetical protein